MDSPGLSELGLFTEAVFLLNGPASILQLTACSKLELIVRILGSIQWLIVLETYLLSQSNAFCGCKTRVYE